MIIRENKVNIEECGNEFMMKFQDKEYNPEDIIFFDLEHYVYKKPKCIGVFGACEYGKKDNSIIVTQYMIEDRDEATNILYLAKDYFIRMKLKGKRTIVTFSGNNDFTVINYLFKENGIEYNFTEEFDSIDIQKEYEKEKKVSTGLKKLEKVFGIEREGEVISGSNLAKTFHKVMKDKNYFKRMPEEKIEKILLYNEQDVINLYYIYVNWKKYIFEDVIEDEIIEKNIDGLEDLEDLEDYNINEDELNNDL